MWQVRWNNSCKRSDCGLKWAYCSAHVVEFLLRQGADRSVETSYGLTALQMAEASCHRDCARLLKPSLPEPVFPPIDTCRGKGNPLDDSLDDSDVSRFHAHLRKVHAHQKVTRWLEDLAQHGMPEPQEPSHCPQQSKSMPKSARRKGILEARRKTSILSMSTTTLDGSMLIPAPNCKRSGRERPLYGQQKPKLRLTQSGPVQCT